MPLLPQPRRRHAAQVLVMPRPLLPQLVLQGEARAWVVAGLLLSLLAFGLLAG